MDDSTLRKVQLCQLDIMKYIHEVCQRHQIPYSIAYGSAIGAVRHGGFIPWDDDLDIVLLREDYDRLLKVLAAEKDARYWLQTYDTDPDYWQPFAKVRKLGTVYKEAEMSQLPDEKCGVWVDIFPLDYVTSPNAFNTRIRKLLVKNITFSLRCRLFKRSLHAFSRRYMPMLLLLSIIPMGWLKKWQEHLMVHQQTDSVCDICDPLGVKAFSVGMFKKLALVNFEDTEFWMMQDYNSYLTQIYGDYMTPPPEDKRGGHNLSECDIVV